MKSILIKLFIIGLCVSFFPIQAIAEGFTGERQIEWFFMREGGSGRGFEVRFTAAHDNPDECSNAFVVEIKTRSKKFAQRVDLLRDAMEQGLTVDLFVKDCDGEGHAKVQAIKVLAPEPEPEPE